MAWQRRGLIKIFYLFNTFPHKVILILGNNKLSENKEKTERRDESEFFLCLHCREEKSLRHVAMVAKFLDLKRWSSIWQKKTRKHWHILRNKTGAHTFPLWLDNAYGRHYQERLLRKNCGNSNRRVLSALSGICSSNAFNSAFYH